MWPFNRKTHARKILNDEPVDIIETKEESANYICVRFKSYSGISIFDIEELEQKFDAYFVQAEFCYALSRLTVFMRKKG